MPNINLEDKEKIIADYNAGMSSPKIAKKYNTSKQTILRRLREWGIDTSAKSKADYTNSKYTFNEHWLDTLDSQEKAYFLGFFYADGSTESLGTKGSYCIKVKLQVQDKYILERFNKLFESDRPLSYVEEYDERWKIMKRAWVMRLGNKHLWHRMCELGCTPNKTFTLVFPDFIPSRLMPHFIRGYFDGDGSIYLRENGKLANIRICGTENMMKGIYNQVKYFTGVEGICYADKKGKKMWLYDIANQRDIKTFCDWIYQGSVIHLTRKYNEYIKFVNTRDFSKQTWSDVGKRLAPYTEEIIKKYVEDKISISRLATQYGCAPSTIDRILVKNGVQKRNTRNQ